MSGRVNFVAVGFPLLVVHFGKRLNEKDFTPERKNSGQK